MCEHVVQGEINLQLIIIMTIIIIIIIIIIYHELDLDRPVSTSSNSLFKGLPSRLLPTSLIQYYFCHSASVHSCYIS